MNVIDYDIKQKVGKNIRYYRLQKGLTQINLAKHTGLRQTYISEVERGKINISILNINLISESLDVPVYILFLDDYIS